MGNCDSRIHFRLVGLDDETERRFFLKQSELSADAVALQMQLQLNAFDIADGLMAHSELIKEEKKRTHVSRVFYKSVHGTWVRMTFDDKFLSYMRQCALDPGTLARPIEVCLKKVKL